MRQQIILLYSGIKGYAEPVELSVQQTCLLNFLLFLPAACLGIWYPQVGQLGAILAAFSTMFVCYLLPLATYIKMKQVEAFKQEQVSFLENYTSQTTMIEVCQGSVRFTDNSKKSPSLVATTVGCVLLMTYGIFVFASQIYYINQQTVSDPELATP